MGAGLRPVSGTLLVGIGWTLYVSSFALPVALENGHVQVGLSALFASVLGTGVFFAAILSDPWMTVQCLPLASACLSNLVMLLSLRTIMGPNDRLLRWVPPVLVALPPVNYLGLIIIPSEFHAELESLPMVGFWVWELSYVFVAIGVFLRRCDTSPAPSLSPLTPRPWGA